MPANAKRGKGAEEGLKRVEERSLACLQSAVAAEPQLLRLGPQPRLARCFGGLQRLEVALRGAGFAGMVTWRSRGEYTE